MYCYQVDCASSGLMSPKLFQIMQSRKNQGCMLNILYNPKDSDKDQLILFNPTHTKTTYNNHLVEILNFTFFTYLWVKNSTISSFVYPFIITFLLSGL